MLMQTSKTLFFLGLVAGAMAACLAAPPASAQVTGEVSVVQTPPPPAVEFKKEPEVILIPQSRVYYVPDLKYDLFRYGRYWYINNEGNWYRARSYRGPFDDVGFSRVPRSIAEVPSRYHKHPLTRDVGEVIQRTVGTKKQPTPGLGDRKSAITRPTGKQAAPTRRTWNRTGNPPVKSPTVRGQKPPAVRKQPGASKPPTSSGVKKPSRAPATKQKAPQSVKKPTGSGGTKKAQPSPAKSNVKKPTKPPPKKSAPQKTKK
jgi:hypothetical protein